MFFRLENEFHPLSLDVWSIDQHGLSSYDLAREYAEFDADTSIDNPVEREIAKGALWATIADQAVRNGDGLSRYVNNIKNYTELEDESEYDNLVSKAYLRDEDYLKARVPPDELVDFLSKNPEIESIEIARRTHLAKWAVRDIIDAPVRRHLDANSSIDSQPTPDESSVYKLKQFCYDNNGDESASRARIERKRVIRQHCGGKVLTIVRNMLLVDYKNPALPADVRDSIIDANPIHHDKDYMYDFDQECEYLHEPLEAHITNRDQDAKPKWVTPMLTTYYSTLREVRNRDK